MAIPPGLSFSRIPVYWLQEESGRMKAIIGKFLENEPLEEPELEILRWYFYQWVAAFPTKPDDFAQILLMSQEELRLYNMRLLNDYGIDPL